MPNIENGTVRIGRQRPALRVVGEPVAPPRRQRNSERRPREYLTPAEIEILIATAKKRGRYGHRDATMILVAYRHGLRVGELCALTWDQVDFCQGLLHVTRLASPRFIHSVARSCVHYGGFDASSPRGATCSRLRGMPP